MPLQTIGTTECPECGETVRVFRHSEAVPRRPLAISVHFVRGSYCKGVGRRVRHELITPLAPPTP